MKHTMKLFVWTLMVVLAATPAMAGNVNFQLGQRSIDTGEDGLDDVEDQPFFGVTVDWHTGNLPISWYAGFYGSTKEEDVNIGGGIDATVTATLVEGSFGVGKTWAFDNTMPFVHGGVALTSVTVEADFDGGFSDIDEDDQSPALYGEGGVFWRLGEKLNIGVAGRVLLGTDYDIDGESFEADYVQAGLILGWGFGS